MTKRQFTARPEPARFTQPRANPPVCSVCDRALYAGGRSYVLVRDPLQPDAAPRPAHNDPACSPPELRVALPRASTPTTSPVGQPAATSAPTMPPPATRTRSRPRR